MSSALWAYIDWSLKPRRKGVHDLLPSEKLRRALADRQEFLRLKAQFAAAKERAPRKKAIEVLMSKWNVNDESTVEKRIARLRKLLEEKARREGWGESRMIALKAYRDDDEIPF
jgi:DNA-binding response OmpR family regulator